MSQNIHPEATPTSSIDALGTHMKTLLDGGELTGYAAHAAAEVLLYNWRAALGNSSTDVLVNDVNQVIERLQQFRDEAAKLLPVVNGGLAGVSLADWRVRLAARDVEIYPCPQHRISRFGYTDCEAADYQSEDDAIMAAVVHYFS